MQHHGGTNSVFQFAHIAGPDVAHQHRARFRIKTLKALAFLGGAFRQKCLSQCQHIIATITQRRQGHWDHMQAIIQILTEAPGAYFFQRVAIGGADKAHIGLQRLAAAHGLKRAGLDEAQQFALQRQIHFANLIKEQRAAIRRPRRTNAVRHCARKSAAHMAEDFAFNQILRDSRAIDGNERPGLAW